jgi:hypothetical protein
MKNFSDIQTLLDRYWEGETTLQEERALKAYFASSQVDERLLAAAPFFQALREEKNLQAPHSSDNSKSSDEYIEKAKTKVIPLKPVHFAWHKLAAAASVALLLSAGAWWWFGKEKPVQEQVVQQTPVQQAQPFSQEKPLEQPAKKAGDATQTEAPKPPVLANKNFPKRKKPATAKPDPEAEQAMEEIKAALALVSSKLKKGKREAAKGAIHLENVDKLFKKKSEGLGGS